MATKLTFDISKARRELHYEPRVRTRDGLRTSARWFREHRVEYLPDGKGRT
jgi:nucleoside-diphosphate-sugar epimerase